MRKRVLAEAELLAGATYRLIREEAGDYVTEISEGEMVHRHTHSGLSVAVRDFADAVIDEEAMHLAEELSKERSNQ